MDHRKVKLLILALAAGLLHNPAVAEEAEQGWSGKASFGYAATSGNSETTTVNLGLTLDYDMKRWHHTIGAGAFGASSQDSTGDEATTAERYKLDYEAKYDLNAHDFLFGRYSFEKDRFSGYDQQVSETVGYGRRVLTGPVHLLNLTIGAGAKQSDLRDGTSENGFVTRLGGNYTWVISPTAKFNQTLAIEISSDNTYTEAASTLAARLLGELALALSYTLKNNSDVPVGSEKTDSFTTLSLQYAF